MSEPSEVPNKEVPDEKDLDKEKITKAIVENWDELNEIAIQDYFSKGWRPRIKTKPDGTRYITIRGRSRDDDGVYHDSEKSLGPYDPERWEILLSMFPKLSSRSHIPVPTDQKPPSILSTRIGRHKAIPASLSIDTDILTYYEFFQRKGYMGTIDEWIHECLRNYFIQNFMEIGIMIRSAGENIE